MAEMAELNAKNRGASRGYSNQSSGMCDFETSVQLAAARATIGRDDETERTRFCSMAGICKNFLLAWERFRRHNYILDHASRGMLMWDWTLAVCVLYTAIFLPLSIVFPKAKWPGSTQFDGTLDFLFAIDLVVKFRTSFPHQGFTVYNPSRCFKNYLQSMFPLDFLAVIPLDTIVAWGITGDGEIPDDGSPLMFLSIIRLLRLLRVRRLVQLSSTAGPWVRIAQVELSFILVAHWLGVSWAAIAIPPLKDVVGPEWVWLDGDATVMEYICSLYWALTVMTNLKGVGTHENRDCLTVSDSTPRPYVERPFAMACFLIGAMVYASIYGSLSQIIASLDTISVRFRGRMEMIREFCEYHNVPPSLRKRIFNYAIFSFSVTKGIDVESVSNQLPSHLQLELFLHLNLKSVSQVPIFEGTPTAFLKCVVMKLRPTVTISNDFVYRKGDPADHVYFIKRGFLQVQTAAGAVLRSCREGDYFGELALLTNDVRAVEIKAITDCMLLALATDDFDALLHTFPDVMRKVHKNANKHYQIQMGGFAADAVSYKKKPLISGNSRTSFVRKLVRQSTTFSHCTNVLGDAPRGSVIFRVIGGQRSRVGPHDDQNEEESPQMTINELAIERRKTLVRESDEAPEGVYPTQPIERSMRGSKGEPRSPTQVGGYDCEPQPTILEGTEPQDNESLRENEPPEETAEANTQSASRSDEPTEMTAAQTELPHSSKEHERKARCSVAGQRRVSLLSMVPSCCKSGASPAGGRKAGAARAAQDENNSASSSTMPPSRRKGSSESMSDIDEERSLRGGDADSADQPLVLPLSAMKSTGTAERKQRSTGSDGEASGPTPSSMMADAELNLEHSKGVGDPCDADSRRGDDRRPSSCCNIINACTLASDIVCRNSAAEEDPDEEEDHPPPAEEDQNSSCRRKRGPRRNSLPTSSLGPAASNAAGSTNGERRRASCPDLGAAARSADEMRMPRRGSCSASSAASATATGPRDGRCGSAVGGSQLPTGRRGSVGGGGESRRASCDGGAGESVLGEGCRLASREAVTNALATGRLDRRITTLIEQLRHDISCTVQVSEEHIENMLEEFEERQREAMVSLQEQMRSANLETHVLLQDLTLLMKSQRGGSCSNALMSEGPNVGFMGRRGSRTAEACPASLQGRRGSRTSTLETTPSAVPRRRSSFTEEGVRPEGPRGSFVPELPGARNPGELIPAGGAAAMRSASLRSNSVSRKESLAMRISQGLKLKKKETGSAGARGVSQSSRDDPGDSLP